MEIIQPNSHILQMKKTRDTAGDASKFLQG